MNATKIITLPNGRAVTLPAYVQAWKTLKAAPPSKEFKGFNHHPSTAQTILREFSWGVQDRINQRGGMVDAQPSPKRCRGNEVRIARMLRKTVRCSCNWCGCPVPYAPKHSRFCSASCVISYRS